MNKLLIIFISLMLFIVIANQGFTKEEEQLPEQVNKESKITLEKVKHYCLELEKICREGNDLNSVMQESGKSMKELARISKQIIPYLIAEFKNKNKNWKYRYLILIQLTYTKDERGIEPTIESLKDEIDEIRTYSAVFLGEMKSKLAVEQLIVILNDKNRHVRVAACNSLGKIGDERAIEPILKRFKKEEDFVARTDFISYTFNKFRDKNIFNQLVDSLKNDSSPDVRGSAARCLGNYKNKRALEHLVNSLFNDEHSLVRFYAAWSLGEIGDRSTIEILKKAENDIDKMVRWGIVEAIKKLEKK